MGKTMQQLAKEMTGHEFGLHLALDRGEPLSPGVEHAVASIVAAQANGPLSRGSKKNWTPSDFVPKRWPEIDESMIAPAAPQAPTLAQLKARARAAGMEV